METSVLTEKPRRQGGMALPGGLLGEEEAVGALHL